MPCWGRHPPTGRPPGTLSPRVGSLPLQLPGSRTFPASTCSRTFPASTCSHWARNLTICDNPSPRSCRQPVHGVWTSLCHRWQSERHPALASSRVGVPLVWAKKKSHQAFIHINSWRTCLQPRKKETLDMVDIMIHIDIRRAADTVIKLTTNYWWNLWISEVTGQLLILVWTCPVEVDPFCHRMKMFHHVSSDSKRPFGPSVQQTASRGHYRIPGCFHPKSSMKNCKHAQRSQRPGPLRLQHLS